MPIPNVWTEVESEFGIQIPTPITCKSYPFFCEIPHVTSLSTVIILEFCGRKVPLLYVYINYEVVPQNKKNKGSTSRERKPRMK